MNVQSADLNRRKCLLYGVETTGSVAHPSTVLILLQPVLQSEPKPLIAAQVSLRIGVYFFVCGLTFPRMVCSSGVGFLGMGYLNHDRRRGKLQSVYIHSKLISYREKRSSSSGRTSLRLSMRKSRPNVPISSDDHGLIPKSFISSYDMYH